MDIVTQEIYDEQCRSKSILQFAKKFKISSVLAQANVCKAKGVGVLTVFLQLMSVGFSGKSLNRLLEEQKLTGKKDVFYRFMDSTSANWYNFIRLLSTLVIAAILHFFPQEEMPLLILDDTLHKRNTVLSLSAWNCRTERRFPSLLSVTSTANVTGWPLAVPIYRCLGNK